MLIPLRDSFLQTTSHLPAARNPRAAYVLAHDRPILCLFAFCHHPIPNLVGFFIAPSCSDIYLIPPSVSSAHIARNLQCRGKRERNGEFLMCQVRERAHGQGLTKHGDETCLRQHLLQAAVLLCSDEIHSLGTGKKLDLLLGLPASRYRKD